MGSEAILEVEGLDAAYGLAQILFNVSLSVARGEIVALMGRNGAGKSTTLKAIMGLVPANARALRFAGRDIRSMSSYRIARLGLGYVPEERRIFTDLTVAENLQVGTKPAIGGEARAPWTPDRLYAIFPNLAEMRGRRASQMSGGEQQMLTIARTLMGNPEAVLLDEPSEGLAPVIVEELARAVKRLAQTSGLAIILVEQNSRLALDIAPRAIVLDRGRIVFDGPSETLRDDPAKLEQFIGVVKA